MPVKIQSVGKGKYRVSTPHGTKAKHTTLSKAKKQERLLNAVDHGWKPTGKPSKRHESVEMKATQVVNVLLGETRKSGHFFYINSDRMTIYTFGPGNHPSNTRNFEDEDDFKRAIVRLKKDGYRLVKDQAKG